MLLLITVMCVIAEIKLQLKIARLCCHNFFVIGGILIGGGRAPWAPLWPSSRTHFQVLGLGLEALGPRKLPCPRLEDSTIF